MSGCFNNKNNENLSSNQYIERKKNKSLFCDFLNNESKIHKVENNTLIKSNNHENLLSLTKGFHNHSQSTNTVNGMFLPDINEQEFTIKPCVKHLDSNLDSSNNYLYGTTVLTHFNNGFQQMVDDGIVFYSEYANIEKENISGNDKFLDKQKLLKRKCFAMHIPIKI